MLINFKGPEEIQLLDIILKELQKDYPENINAHMLLDRCIIKLFGINAKKTDDEFSIRNRIVFKNIFDNALDFLNDESLIIHKKYKGGDTLTKIRYSGIVKIAEGGFMGEYKSKRRDKFLQRMFWIVAGLSLCLSIITIFLK